MSRRLILHIGHYKTGTTALQVYCERNAAALARAGVTYAATERFHCKHSVFAFSLLHAAGMQRLMYRYSRPEPPEDIWAPLLDEVRAAPTPQVLVSSEEFMRLALVPAAMDRLRAILARVPDLRLQVVAYVRPIGPHLRSWYNQLVKLRQTLAGYQTALVTEIEPIHYDYALALQPWADLAGPGGLQVRPYDFRLRQGDALYRDFHEALGVPMPSQPDLPPEDPNPRLDDRLLDVMRLAHEGRLEADDVAQLTRRLTRRLNLNAQAAKDEVAAVAAIRARARDSVAAVARFAARELPMDWFQAALPEGATALDTQREALVEVLMRERTERAAETRQLRARLAELEAQIAAEGRPGAAPG